LKQKELEDTIINLLTDKLLNSSEIENLTQKINEQYKIIYNESFDELSALKEQIVDKQKQIDNITNAIASGVSSTALLKKLEQLEGVKELLEDKLNFNKNINKMPEISLEKIKELLKKDTNKLAKNTQSKEIIKKWIKKIEVLDNEIIVHFTLDGSSPSHWLRGPATSNIKGFRDYLKP